MDEEQRFAFDTWGFLTVEEAITPKQVAELKALVSTFPRADAGWRVCQRQERGCAGVRVGVPFE